LLSSHLLDEVDRICDNVVIIAAGRVTRSGDLSSLRGQVTGLVLEVDDLVAEIATSLRASGCAVDVDGYSMSITGTGQLHDLARDAVSAAGVGLRRLVDRQVTLEDVFLEANDAAVSAQ
jgi:ABC-2 type transport system ATP-binding protein